MSESFVPPAFPVPPGFVGPGFRLEPLGPEHNDRDHRAWTSSVAHIRATPGFEKSTWPRPMSLEENLADLVRHHEDFLSRRGFTYSVLDDNDVIGCVYIYPSARYGADADVTSWVTKDRAELDAVLWREVSAWLTRCWPFHNPHYPPRE